MDLSIITVTWNSAKRIVEQMVSVSMGSRNITCEQIIIDNNSSDNTVELVKKTSSSAKLIENKENVGFGRANNQGVKIASGNFILFLNPDMRVDFGVLDRMVNWMAENKEVGIMGCKLLNKNKEINLNSMPRRFPTLKDQLAVLFKLPHFFPKILDKYLCRDLDFGKIQEVDSVQGSFMLVRREVIEKLGHAFDERFFIWFEDVDLCREAKKLGYKVVYNPTWECIDYGGQSFSQRSFFWKQYNFTKSMIVYFKKWPRSKFGVPSDTSGGVEL